MDSAALYLIQGFLLGLAIIICFFILFRDNLRWSVRTTLIIYATYCVYYLIEGTVGRSVLPLMIIDPLYFYGILFLCLDKNRVNSFTCLYLFAAMFNTIAAIFFAFAYGLLSLFQGKWDWLVLDETGIGFRIVLLILFVPAFAFALKLTHILEDDILDLSGALKWILFVILPLKTFALQIIKSMTMSIPEYRNDPTGIGYFLDTIDVLLTLVSLLIIVVIHVKRVRNKYKHIRSQELTDSENYEKEVTDLTSSLRQINHDAAGWQKDLAKAGHAAEDPDE